MSVITFVDNKDEECGKTLSLVAIATHIAIEQNLKILIISTTDKEDRVGSCFFVEKEQVRKIKRGIFGENTKALEIESGIEGVVKLVRSNKLTASLITNYTRVVFKNRLELLLGKEKIDDEENKKEENSLDPLSNKPIDEEYINIIANASQYYDRVFVDLDMNVSEENRKRILEMSDLVITTTSQNFKSLDELREKKMQSEFLNSTKNLFLIGRYDKYSKYNAKNVTRFLNEKNQILTVPYNTLYFEAAGEAGVPDLFLRLRKMNDPDDRNAIFKSEIKRATDNINYRLEELKARLY